MLLSFKIMRSNVKVANKMKSSKLQNCIFQNFRFSRFHEFWSLSLAFRRCLCSYRRAAAQKQLFCSARAFVKRGAFAPRFAFPCCAESSVYILSLVTAWSSFLQRFLAARTGISWSTFEEENASHSTFTLLVKVECHKSMLFSEKNRFVFTVFLLHCWFSGVIANSSSKKRIKNEEISENRENSGYSNL